MAFTKDAVETVGGDWQEIKELNNTLQKMKEKRRSSVEPGGEFGLSKVAWKIGGFQQVILYRTVMLAEGCSLMWNTRNILGAILCARALMENVALVADFENQLQRLSAANDLGAIDNLVTNRTFSTRLERWYEEGDNIYAKNITTHIDKLDKLIEGARHHYDLLSEMCHPNSLGHNFLFGKLDRDTATIALSETHCFGEYMFHTIIAAFGLIQLVENRLHEIGQLMPTVVKISEAARQKSAK